MKSKNIFVLRISKVRYANGNYEFVIGENLSTLPCTVSLPGGTIPKIGSEEYEKLRREMQCTLEHVFMLARKSPADKEALEYKCIFSDKFIATGSVSASTPQRVEISKELTLPMNETECSFIFDCIPTQY